MLNFFLSKKGQAFVEYALIIVFVGFIIALGSKELFDSTKKNYYAGLLPTNTTKRTDLPPAPEGFPDMGKKSPTAIINGPLQVHRGDWVTYTDASKDLDGTIKAISWGGYFASQSGKTVKIQFPEEGSYEIKLTVMDNDGLTGTTSITVQVGNKKPIPNIVLNPSGSALWNKDIVISSTGTNDPDGDKITEWQWKLDGVIQNWPLAGNTGRLPIGTHTISLNVKDHWELWGDEVSKTITILDNDKPDAVITTNPVNSALYNQSVSISAIKSQDSNGDKITQWVWTLNGVQQSWPYDGYSQKLPAGTNTITLKVADEWGKWSDVTSKVITIVGNRAPSVTINMNPSSNIKDNTTITFGYAYSDPDGDAMAAIQWQKDGGTITSSPPNGTFTAGTHTVQVRVQDAGGTWSAWSSVTFNSISSYVPVSLTYTYTGGVQTWTVPSTGKYKIEAWGAQGGKGNYSNQKRGGYGGYSYGEVDLTAGEVIYIYVGGMGGTSTAGWNGGGQGAYSGASGGGGGGASDIRRYGNALTNRILVAGGGGGAEYDDAGDPTSGEGGGLSGNRGLGDSPSAAGYGGTQTYGGSAGGSGASFGGFGYGGNGASAHGGGGGGGYYGGGGGDVDGDGGGGSSYYGGMKSGTTGTTVGANSGNGYIKINSIP